MKVHEDETFARFLESFRFGGVSVTNLGSLLAKDYQGVAGFVTKGVLDGFDPCQEEI